jgi:hypothetical protein
MIDAGPEMRIPEELKSLEVDGDWIIRTESSLEQRARGLQFIFRSVTRRELFIQNTFRDQEVVIVRGSWEVRQKPKDARPVLIMAFQDSDLPWDWLGGGVRGFLGRLQRLLNCKVIDETREPRPKEVWWREEGVLGTDLEKSLSREQVLQDLSSDTRLEFVKARRVIRVWCITENAPASEEKN